LAQKSHGNLGPFWQRPSLHALIRGAAGGIGLFLLPLLLQEPRGHGGPVENLAPVMAAKRIEICRIQSYRGKLLLFCGIAIDILVWGYGAIFLSDVAYGCL